MLPVRIAQAIESSDFALAWREGGALPGRSAVRFATGDVRRGFAHQSVMVEGIFYARACAKKLHRPDFEEGHCRGTL